LRSAGTTTGDDHGPNGRRLWHRHAPVERFV